MPIEPIYSIAYSLFLTKPVIFWLGLSTFTLLCLTAIAGYLHHRGAIKFKWHKVLAALLIIVAIIHMSMGLSAYL